MAEGGTEKESYSEGSAEANDVIHVCQPCDEEGERAEAQGFCKVCKEHLCRMCIKIHHRTPVLKCHEIVDTLEVSPEEDGSENTLRQSSFEKCLAHSKQYCKFYCPSHDVFGCGDCTVMDHRTCEIQYLPDVAKGFKEGKEYTDQQSSLQELGSTLETCIEKVNENTASVREISANVVDTIKNFSSEIKAKVDQRENEMLESVEKMKIEQETPLNQLNEECAGMKDTIAATKVDLRASEKECIKLFMASKRTKQKIISTKTLVQKIDAQCENHVVQSIEFRKDLDLEEKLSSQDFLGTLGGEIDAQCENHVVQSIEFRKNLDLEEKLSSQDILGTFGGDVKKVDVVCKKVNLATAEFTRETDINAGASVITGLARMSPSRLFIVDKNANSCTIFDTTNKQIISHLKVDSQPWDVALLPFNQAVVSLPYVEQIRIVSTANDNLKYVRKVETEGSCFGIAYSSGKLAVSFSPTKERNARVEIRNLSGDYLYGTCSLNNHGEPLFRDPRYVKFVSEGRQDVLHVSDTASAWGYGLLTKILTDGKVIAVNNEWDFVGNHAGISECSDGQLFICNYGQNCVYLIGSDMKSVPVLKETDGILYPQAVCYCEEEGRLYISSRNKVMVYRIK